MSLLTRGSSKRRGMIQWSDPSRIAKRHPGGRDRITLKAFLIVIVVSFQGISQQRDLFPSDTLPHDRLLTNQELLQFLDLSKPPLTHVSSILSSGDTAGALRAYVGHLKTRTTPSYFFDPAGMMQRAAVYQETYPEDEDYMSRTAVKYMKTYGTDVDWRVPGKDLLGVPHTPNTVRMLARQLYAENFALMSLLNSDGSYAAFQMGQLRDFLADVEAGKAERGGNDVFERFYGGHRIRNLMVFHQMLLASDYLSDEDHLLLVRSFLLHGTIIIQRCSSFNWGNHQLVGLCALYEMTLLYPEFPVMREWNARVYDLILEHLQKEVMEDGFQFERASHYFKLDIYNYFRVFQLARKNDVPIPGWATERFRKMFDAIVSVLMPNGAMPPLQDAQDTYIGTRNISEARKSLGVSETPNSAELVDPDEGPFLSLGAYLFDEPRFRYFGDDKLHPAFSWFVPEDANDTYRTIGTRRPDFTSVALPATGYYVMRSGWDQDDAYMIIDGGLAKYKPDHTHGGVLGVIAYANGAMILPNYRVRYSEPSYPFLKNSYVKNVALADSMLQGRGWIGNKAKTGFGKWAWLPTPVVHAWTAGESYDYFRGTHDAFDTIAVSYERSILYIKPSIWVFVDRFDGGTDEHSYQQVWQGAFTLKQPAGAYSVTGSSRLDIDQASAEGLSMDLGAAEGKTSVAFSGPTELARSFVTVLRTSSDVRSEPAVVTKGEDGSVRIPVGEDIFEVYIPSTSSDGAYAVRSDRSGAVQAAVFGVRSFTVAGLTISSPESVSMELHRSAERRWEGILTGGSGAGMVVRMSDGSETNIDVLKNKTFTIEW